MSSMKSDIEIGGIKIGAVELKDENSDKRVMVKTDECRDLCVEVRVGDAAVSSASTTATERVVDFSRSEFLGALKVSGQNREVFRSSLLGVLELRRKLLRKIKRKKATWGF